jgi:hypothetical protein
MYASNNDADLSETLVFRVLCPHLLYPERFPYPFFPFIILFFLSQYPIKVPDTQNPLSSRPSPLQQAPTEISKITLRSCFQVPF